MGLQLKGGYVMFKKNGSKENFYEYLTSSNKKMDIFNKRVTSIVKQIMIENESISKHAKNIINLNNCLIEENRVLLEENTELKRVLNGLNDMIYVTCPHCNSDQNIVTSKDNEGSTVITKLITRGDCITTCHVCGKSYKIYNGKIKIETTKE